MNKPHATLRLSTNLFLIFAWVLATVIFAAVSDPLPMVEIAAGCFLGALGGYMQLLSFKEGREKFLQTRTALEVRAKLRETKWGKRYIYFLWFAGAVLVFLSVLISKNPLFSFPAAYFAMMFVREIVTLKPTLELRRMQALQ